MLLIEQKLLIPCPPQQTILLSASVNLTSGQDFERGSVRAKVKKWSILPSASRHPGNSWLWTLSWKIGTCLVRFKRKTIPEERRAYAHQLRKLEALHFPSVPLLLPIYLYTGFWFLFPKHWLHYGHSPAPQFTVNIVVWGIQVKFLNLQNYGFLVDIENTYN